MTVLSILYDVWQSEDEFTITLIFKKSYDNIMNTLNIVNMTKYINVNIRM